MASPLSPTDGTGSSSFDPYTTDVPEEHAKTRTRSIDSEQEATSSPDLLTASNSASPHPPPETNAPYSLLPSEQRGAHISDHTANRKRKLSSGTSDPSRELDFSGPGGGEHAPDLSTGHQMESGYSPERYKRSKLDGDNLSSVHPPEGENLESNVSQNRSNLPGELWQHIFTFLPPKSLGRLLRVNKAFRSLLTPSEMEFFNQPATIGLLKYINPNSIWATSRKQFHPGMPRPLSILNELDMWKLVGGSGCQFCFKPGSPMHLEATPNESGPGPDGVRIIWPFGVRCCGECLQERSEKEMDLLLSSSLPSLLVPALPFAFFTPSMQFVSSIALRGGHSASGLTKYFFKPSISELQQRFEEVKSLGPAATEEWVKGLEGNGKEKLADISRWEQWEAAGGLRSLNMNLSHRPGMSSFHISKDSMSKSNLLADPVSGQSASPVTYKPHSSPTIPAHTSGPPYSPDKHHTLPPTSSHQARTERSLREVNEAKANRRAEIERRALGLDPPLAASVLTHMDSFTAAIQIPHTLSERDWEILKPRLLAQRALAEHREQERQKQSLIMQAKSEERRQQEAQLKEQKDLLDREWEEVQKPIRERMAEYADEIIREGWRGGDAVTREKAPKFAADVLIYVRDRFYTDLAQQDVVARSAGKPIPEDAHGAPPTRKIILENMKWIFDTKIKPLAEQFQKELFLCNVCENNSKFYGFEGVVQHYAAKHTNALSLGSIVVHWRAEWPETPPFHPNPNAAKALLYTMPRGGMGQRSHGYHHNQQMYNMPGPDQGHHMPPDGGAIFPQASPGPYSRTPFGTPYPYSGGPYRPPSPYYQQPQSAYPPPPPSGPYDQHVPPPPPNPYGSPYPGQAYPPPYAPPDSRGPQPYHSGPYGAPPPVPPSYGAPYPPPSQQRRPGQQSNPNSQAFGIYQTQLDDMAKIARSIWNGTSGIKDLPHNVRAHVLIHHVIVRFSEKCGNEPALSLFADGLNGHPQMKPMKNLSGLVCKACSESDYPGRIHTHRDGGRGDRNMYTLPALISHFQSHIDRAKAMDSERPRVDWKRDMIVLPDNPIVADLVNAPGMDEHKLRLVTAAFPWVFSTPTLSIHQSKAPSGGNIKPEEEERSDIKPGLSRPNRAMEVAVDDFPPFVDSPAAEATGTLDPPKDDEYDPHKPGFIEPIGEQHGRGVNHRSKQNIPPGFGRQGQGSRAHGHPIMSGDLANTHHRRRGAGHMADIEMSNSADIQHRSSAQASTKLYSQYQSRSIKSEYPLEIPPSSTSLKETGKAGSQHGNVSEDGEVEELPNSQEDHRKAASSPMDDMNAAERFLSTFVPGEDSDVYKGAKKEPSRHIDDGARGRWLEAPDQDSRRWRTDVGSGGTAESSVVGTPTHNVQHNGWGSRTRSPGGGFRDLEPRHDTGDNSGLLVARHVQDRSPDPGEVRYGRKHAGFSETRHPSDQAGRRPNSRFDRYEAQRGRSRSPMVHEPMPMEPVYYRERSPRARQRPRPAYAGHPADPYHDQVPVEQAVTYARVPPRGQYQYVDHPRYTAEPSYDNAVEYIRVPSREHQDAGAYYVEHPMQRDAPKEYLDYDIDYTQQPAARHGQYHPSGAAPQHSRVPSGGVPRHARYR